jgi:hypothetical protein
MFSPFPCKLVTLFARLPEANARDGEVETVGLWLVTGDGYRGISRLRTTHGCG